MTLLPYLNSQRAAVESALEAHLPAADLRPARLHEAMRYSMMAGGKRLRPILAMATGELLHVEPELLLKPALALELFHTYTLIHDDLPCMDDDDLRRGRPTAHIQFDEATAVLAGDALLTLAFEWMAEGGAALVTELAQAGGHAGVIAGQIADLAAETKAPDADELDYIHLNKTAALLRCSIRVGAIIGKADSATLQNLTTFGEYIGLAFQIIDDILDATASTETLGKPAGSDQAQGKTTYVDLYGIEAARKRADDFFTSALDHLHRVDGNTEKLEGIARFICERDR
jgi:geranylgeranyl pyrophosphate synthase